MKNRLLYQVFVGRLEGYDQLNYRHKVLERMRLLPWQKLTQAGFDAVYLLGIFDHQGPIIVDEESGEDISHVSRRTPSVFAVNDHKQIDPELGNIVDFKELVTTIHQAGLGVLVDFIPNQVGMEHHWVKEQPDFVINEKIFSGDVFKLNYENLKLREAMTEILMAIAGLGVDGVRVDMAHLIDKKNWEEIIGKLKLKYADFYLLAEAYTPSPFNLTPLFKLMEAGFNGVYDELFFRNCKEVLENRAPLEYLIKHLTYLSLKGFNRKLTRYIANHDESMGQRFFDYQEALLTLGRLMDSNFLIYNGQLNGQISRLRHHVLDILNQDKSEFFKIPNWFLNLTQVLKAFPFEILKMEVIENSLVVIWLKAQITSAVAVVNLGDLPKKNPIKEVTEGLLHGYTAEHRFDPGEVEIYAT